jgi:hypothetical protein
LRPKNQGFCYILQYRENIPIHGRMCCGRHLKKYVSSTPLIFWICDMRFGYARVSTDDQTLDLQRDALKRAKCRQIYEEHASGKTTVRPGADSWRSSVQARNPSSKRRFVNSCGKRQPHRR